MVECEEIPFNCVVSLGHDEYCKTLLTKLHLHSFDSPFDFQKNTVVQIIHHFQSNFSAVSTSTKKLLSKNDPNAFYKLAAAANLKRIISSISIKTLYVYIHIDPSTSPQMFASDMQDVYDTIAYYHQYDAPLPHLLAIRLYQKNYRRGIIIKDRTESYSVLDVYLKHTLDEANDLDTEMVDSIFRWFKFELRELYT
jgi:hypothetical protein